MALTRFAPAPTGQLHLGHVANAIYVWGLGQLQGADVLLRIEDHDRQRCRQAFETGILDDLDWLGFVPDRFPTDAFRAGPSASRQSDRLATYESHCRRLLDAGLVYGCECSRQDLAGGDTSRRLANDGCPRGCRQRGIPPEAGVAWRVAMAWCPASFDDLLVGSHGASRPTAGDPVIRDRRSNWTYQFAVVVDDFDQQVDLVIRGQDLLDSTPLQIGLAALLGRRQPPQFAHHPLVMKSATQKLSKSDADTGIADLRRAGWTPERVIGRAAFLVGLTSDDAPTEADRAAELVARRPDGHK